ncbi:MAG: TOBE-like domain-containing protein, partial [Bradyrhizobiaceae bacterium]|nr:TOBE-like domain-containing protein [Bradyrhizobiaceae bacterium]
VTIENGVVSHTGRPTGLDNQGVCNGPGTLFVRPYDMAVVPLAEATFAGQVTRIHGLGPARRIEVTLQSDGSVVEVDLPRTYEVSAGQTIGLRPLHYRIFAGASR